MTRTLESLTAIGEGLVPFGAVGHSIADELGVVGKKSDDWAPRGHPIYSTQPFQEPTTTSETFHAANARNAEHLESAQRTIQTPSLPIRSAWQTRRPAKVRPRVTSKCKPNHVEVHRIHPKVPSKALRGASDQLQSAIEGASRCIGCAGSYECRR